MADTYVEVVGSVVNDTTIKMLSCVNLGPELGASHSLFNYLELTILRLRLEVGQRHH